MKTVVIGAGSMGRRHIQAIMEMGLELVGICDTKTDALAKVASEFGIGDDKLFTDSLALLNSGKPDCVVIATTAPFHHQLTLDGARSGAKFILCEKPMAVSLQQCDQMLEVCNQHGTRLAINHQMRFMKHYHALKEIITSEAFGGLTSITIIGGNFGLAMNSTHMFEMFRYMTNELPYEVTAWFSPDIVPNPRGIEFQDRAGSIRVTTASGKRLYIEAGSDQGHGITMIFAGRYGQAVWNQLTGILTLDMRQTADRNYPTTRYAMASNTSHQQFEPVNIVEATRLTLDSLITGKDYPTGEDGRNAITTLVAVYVSAENGNIAVKVDQTTLPSDRLFPWA